MGYDFDRVIDRHGTGSLKYDCAEERGHSPEELSLWVADMDFEVPREVTDALVARARHGIFGYTEPTAGYFDAVGDWLESRQGWRPERSWFTLTPGVVYALACCVRAYTNPGEAVLIQQPVYYPFSEVIRDNDRVVVNSPLVLSDGTYQVDFDAFERTIKENDVRLFLLCNPHNPGGRVWSAAELERMGRICLRHGVVVVSDEIHADFARPGFAHASFGTQAAELLDNVVICQSPTKTFNIAGLQISNIIIPNEGLRARFRHQNDAAGYSQVNCFGVVAAEAAYRHGAEWLAELKDYLEGNLDLLCQVLSDRTPELAVMVPQSTYLVWVDCRSLGLSDAELTALVEKDAGLWLDMGDIFGSDGSGFIRWNIACPRSVLATALDQFASAVEARR